MTILFGENRLKSKKTDPTFPPRLAHKNRFSAKSDQQVNHSSLFFLTRIVYPFDCNDLKSLEFMEYMYLLNRCIQTDEEGETLAESKGQKHLEGIGS